MRFPRILAYADSSEWQDTYEQMNTERVLGAWQTRVKSLPHAVESTFQMHAALVKLQSLTLGGGGLTATTTGVDTSPAVSAAASMHARMAASLAFIKFINGLVDPLQSGRYAASIHAIALDALPTLPTWFIDLRHQATHDPVLPSHAVLVNALSQALRWLKTEYWDVERGALLQQSHQLHLDWEQQLLKHRHHRSLVGNLALECKSHLVLYRDAVAEAHENSNQLLLPNPSSSSSLKSRKKSVPKTPFPSTQSTTHSLALALKSASTHIHSLLNLFHELAVASLSFNPDPRRQMDEEEGEQQNDVSNNYFATSSSNLDRQSALLDLLSSHLVPSLLRVGFLVPSSKRKRPTFPSMELSEDQTRLWMPVLELIGKAVASSTGASDSDERMEQDSSFNNNNNNNNSSSSTADSYSSAFLVELCTRIMAILLDPIDVKGIKRTDGVGRRGESTLANNNNNNNDDDDDVLENEDQSSQSYHATLACWILHLIPVIIEGEIALAENMDNYLFNQELLAVFLSKPNIYTLMFLKKIIKEYKAREMKRQDKLTKSVADNHPSSSSSLPTTSKNKLAVLETLIRYIQNGVVDVKILEDRLSSTTAASTATATSSVSAIASTPRGGKSSAAKSRKASASVGIDDGDNGDDAIISALLRETIDVEKELEPYKQNCTQLRLKVYPPSDVAINRKGMELEDIGDLNEKTHTLPTSTMTTIEEAVMGRSTTQGDNDGRSSRWHPYSRSTWRQAPFGCIARRRQGGVKSNTLQPVYSVGSLDIPATDTGFRIIVDDSYGMCALSNGVVEEGVVVEGHVEGDEQQSETVATTARDLHHQVDYSALVESLKQSIVLF